ncbi:MAG: cobalamin B12-binding domain-containing protein [Nitrospirae bacterium]|nr:cobalamin B12-binding domain-containing protein [Nitrospirota bacterium]
MRVLLINPFFPTSRTPDKKRWYSYFPFGIAYVASYLIQKGVDVEVLDVLGECLSIEEAKDRIKNTTADVVGITGMSSQYLYVKGLASFIKKTLNVPVILGGALSTYSYETVLKNTDVDICVIGEGEFASYEIIENLNNPSRVKGIAFKKGTNIDVTASRTPTRNRDIIPFPAYKLFDMERYTRTSLYSEAKTAKRYTDLKCAYLITGTGCPFKCNFCSKTLSVGYRSVDNIIEEIKYLMETYNVKGFHFGDELLVINRKRMIEFAQKVKPLNILWAGQARVDTVDYELLKIMKESGCVAIGYGIESGSQRLLDAMNKGVKLKQTENAMRWAMDLGLEMKIQLMIGYPGEDQTTLQETVDFFKRIGHPGRRFNIFTPLPGSKTYNDCIRDGLIEDEEDYLHKLSLGEYGFTFSKPLMNFSNFSDEELIEKRQWAEKEMVKNYKRYLLKHPKSLLGHIGKEIGPFIKKQFKKYSRYFTLSYYRKKMKKGKIDKKIRKRDSAYRYFLWLDDIS